MPLRVVTAWRKINAQTGLMGAQGSQVWGLWRAAISIRRDAQTTSGMRKAACRKCLCHVASGVKTPRARAAQETRNMLFIRPATRPRPRGRSPPRSAMAPLGKWAVERGAMERAKTFVQGPRRKKMEEARPIAVSSP